MRSSARRAFVLVAASILPVLAACENTTPSNVPMGDPRDQRLVDQYGLLGGGPVRILGGGRDDSAQNQGGGGIGVNAYLWRGAVETVSFMPLQSADPFGGLILTDWYQTEQRPEERMKLQILITDTTLRADGVRASVIRQVRGKGGEWLNAPVDPATATAIEDRILSRARELRVAGLPQ